MPDATASSFFTTDDGVRLHYLEAGRGRPLVMLPAWSVPAAQLRTLMAPLSRTHRCVALDYRGHGASERPAHGYRLPRLAMDCRQLLDHLEIGDAVLFGHSAGCAVIWSFIDLFGEAAIRALVLCDQMAAGLRRPDWSAAQCQQFGAVYGGDEALATAAAIAGRDGDKVRRAFLASMFTPAYPPAAVAAFVDDALALPGPFAAQFMLSVVAADFRDLLGRIGRPTLCIGGAASHLAHAMPWVASQIRGAQLVMVDADAGGSHFMLLENPAAVCAAVERFLAGVAS